MDNLLKDNNTNGVLKNEQLNVLPQTPSINIPSKISSDVLSYTAPASNIEKPINNFNQSMNAMTSSVMQSQPAPEVKLTDREMAIKDRQNAIDQFLDKDTGYSAKSLQLQQEEKLPELKKQLSSIEVKDIALQNQLKDFEDNLLNKNQQGLFGGAGQQSISQYQRDVTSQRTNLAIQKLALQGDIKGATDMINLKLNSQFEPIKQRLDYLDKTLTIYNNDLSDKQKTQLELEKTNLQNTIKSKEDFQKIIDQAGLAGASVEEINNATNLFSTGDRAGAINSISKYVKATGEQSLTNNMSPAQLANYMQITNKFQADPILKAANQGKTAISIADRVLQDPANAGGQLSILYTLVKSLDPDSAVREGEVGLAQTTQSYFSKFKTSLERIATGKPISDSSAKVLAEETKKLAQSWYDAGLLRENQYVSQATVAGVGDSFNQYLSGYDRPYSQSSSKKQTTGSKIINTKVGAVDNSWFD